MKSIEEILANTQKLAADRRAAVESFMAQQPPLKSCVRHPEVQRPLSLECTRARTAENYSKLTAGYSPCPLCAAEKLEAETRDRLKAAGVPGNLLDCSLENWTPRNAQSLEALDVVRGFVTSSTGFLVLLGNPGVGKTHLAIAALRTSRRPMFLSHAKLVRDLRRSYGDNSRTSPVDRCFRAEFLALDDVGTGGNGSDGDQAAREIVTERYEERRPTIITSNLAWERLNDFLGPRVSDRLRESAFHVLSLGGESYRRLKREEYFRE